MQGRDDIPMSGAYAPFGWWGTYFLKNIAHMMQMPKHNKVHDNKFENTGIIDKQLNVPR